jgi:hypothetical protein
VAFPPEVMAFRAIAPNYRPGRATARNVVGQNLMPEDFRFPRLSRIVIPAFTGMTP